MQTYNETQKLKLVGLYESGMRAQQICRTFSIPRSTLYYWLKKHKKIKMDNGAAVTAKDYYLLEKKLRKVQTEYSILIECGCNADSSRKEKLEAIARLDGKYTIHALCRTLNILRSTYYHYKLRRPEQTLIEKEDEMYKPIIKDIFDSTKERVGAKKIQAIMRNQGYKTTSKRITRLMNEMGLVCISRKKNKHYNHSPARKFRKNKLRREFTTDKPNKVWVSDITSINLNYEPHYLCAVIDLYSRKVIAYNVADNQETSLVMKTFMDAYKSRNPKEDLMFHSDQGLQYTSYVFRKRLRDLGVKQSFSEPGCPHECAVDNLICVRLLLQRISLLYLNRCQIVETLMWTTLIKEIDIFIN